MTYCRQPGGAAVTRIWLVVCCKHTSDCVFIKRQPECQIDLLSDSGTAESWVAAFHLDDGINDFSGRAFGSRFNAHRLVKIAVDTFGSSVHCETEVGSKA